MIQTKATGDALSEKSGQHLDDGGPAFPWGEHGQILGGMSLRDWFAGQVISGMHASLASTTSWPEGNYLNEMAEIAYSQANAMLQARSRNDDRTDEPERTAVCMNQPLKHPGPTP